MSELRNGIRRLGLLIRIQNQHLDATRQRLQKLELDLGERQSQMQQLILEVRNQKQFTARHSAYVQTWRAYLKTAQRQEKEIAMAMSALNRHIHRERSTMQEIFRTLKSYEIAQEQLQNQAARLAQRQEQAEMDEMATIRYTRSRSAHHKD